MRIFNLPKIEYTLRTIKSIVNSCEKAKKFFNDVEIKIIVIDDKSKEENLNKINQILQDSKLETKIISLKEDEFNKDIKILEKKRKNISNNMISNMRNILKSIEIAEKNYNGFVIANQGTNFSVGANIAMIFMMAIEQEYE